MPRHWPAEAPANWSLNLILSTSVCCAGRNPPNLETSKLQNSCHCVGAGFPASTDSVGTALRQRVLLGFSPVLQWPGSFQTASGESAMSKSALLLSSAVLAAGVVFAEKTHVPKIDPERMRATVKYLSNDELEGRGTGQRGGDAAANWIADQFKSYGLKPGGSNGSYFQDVPMVGVRSLPATTFTFVPANGAPVELKNLEDYVTSNETQTESADVDAPVVFVGYGITSPENNWDDYKGYDLRGKVALLFVSEPESKDPNFFKGKALTYNGRWTYKFEETARRGAVGTLVIHRTDLASYPWEVVRNSWGAERSYSRLEGTPKLEAASWIQLEVARKLVAMGGLNLDDLYKQSPSRDFKPIELPGHLKAHIVSSIRPFSSRNVLAMVEGSDTDHRRGEAVLYTAHYDHFGIDPARAKGDQIYHGAVDNASGCGVLLEIASSCAAPNN